MAEIGKPIDRVGGRLKVTGSAKYAAEFNQPQIAFAFPVRATVARGTITKFELEAAQKSAGVITILTHENAPRLKAFNAEEMMKAGAILGEELLPLQDNKIHYYGQFVACVVAETYEQARCAAGLVEINYAQQKPLIDLSEASAASDGMRPEKTVLQTEAQLNAGKAAPLIAAVNRKIERDYRTSTEIHNPLEPHASVAVWEGADKLTIYAATQAVQRERATMAYFFDLKPENVRVLSKFVGGAFGGKANAWTSNFLAVMAAQATKRLVKLVITRQMMQTNVGRRTETKQQVALGASAQGKISAIRHHSDSYVGLGKYFEATGFATESLYTALLREITHKTVRLNVNTPTFMRAPGYTPGSFALESAMDELAFELKIDPLELRRMNHTAVDLLKKIPFSSENLLECYRVGAEKFGWARRESEPRTVRSGNWLIGMGMATAIYHGNRSQASARVEMKADGSVTVLCATHDLGTGTYTICAQTVADALGIPVESITVKIGDSDLPPAPVAAGSQTTASIHPAIQSACEILRGDLMRLALADGKSKLKGARMEEIEFADAEFFVRGDRSKSDSYHDILRRSNKSVIEACATTQPVSGAGSTIPGAPCQPTNAPADNNSDTKKYSFNSFGAQFAEVWVDEDLGIVRVKRFTSVMDVGRVMNEKTARSQIIGSVVWGIGSALMEETAYDNRYANPVQRSFADYHVPVCLDVPEIDVHFINKPDPHISPIGARGAGEIGIVGVSAAIANAVFNATGKRMRNLPITPDKLL